MSARMNSSSASPDFVRMSRSEAAMDASLRPIRSVTMAGSVSIGAGAPPTRGPGGGSVGGCAARPPCVVVGAAEAGFAPRAELPEPRALRLRQCRLLVPLGLDRHVARPASRHGENGALLGADRLGDDLAVAHL